VTVETSVSRLRPGLVSLATLLLAPTTAAVLPAVALAKGPIPTMSLCGASGCAPSRPIETFWRQLELALIPPPRVAPFVVLATSKSSAYFVYVPSTQAVLVIWPPGAKLRPSWRRFSPFVRPLQTNRVRPFPAPRDWADTVALARTLPPASAHSVPWLWVVLPASLLILAACVSVIGIPKARSRLVPR
jgi:hypothetical protein